MEEHVNKGAKSHETWRIAAEWISGVFIVLHLVFGVFDFWEDVSKRRSAFSFLRGHGYYLAIFFAAIFVWAVAHYPRLRAAVFRVIFGKKPKMPAETPMFFRGLQPYRSGEHLPGRRADGEKCWLMLSDSAFMVLEGESGCGKSSLLNAIVMPKAQEMFTAVRMRVRDDPYKNTMEALHQLAPALCGGAADAEALTAVFVAIAQQSAATPGAKPLLLCIDQFEELFGSVNDKARRSFLETLRAAIEAGQLRLLLVIRIDFSDLLVNLCCDVDPEGAALNMSKFYVLKPFTKAQAGAVVGEIFAPVVSENVELEPQMEAFEDSLVTDLLRPPRDERLSRDDEKTVLPAELQMVGQMIESLGVDQFTARSFRAHGGRTGLLNLYIEQAKISVSRMGVPGDRALLILRQLVPRAQTRVARTPGEIAQALNVPVPQVTKALEAFSELRLVNRLPKDSASGAPDASGARYELMHEHLARILEQAPDKTLRKAKEAEDRLAFWRARSAAEDQAIKAATAGRFYGRVWNLFTQPIPLAEIARLWTSARLPADRRMLLRSLRGFALQAALVVSGVVVFLAARYSDQYQIYAITATPPAIDPATMIMTAANAPRGASPNGGARVLDNWIAIEWQTGYQKQARAALENALQHLREESANTDYSDLAAVYLYTRQAQISFATGDKPGTQKGFEDAENAYKKFSARGYPDLRFYAAARIAEIYSLTSQNQAALDWWNTAFDVAKTGADAGDEYLYAVRGLYSLPEGKPREDLIERAIAVVRETWFAPDNIRALSTIAADLYGNGESTGAKQRAVELWRDAVDDARQFVTPPLQDLSSPTNRPVPPPARSKTGDAIELAPYAPLAYTRARYLAGIANQLYAAGATDEAQKVLAMSLAEGAKIGEPISGVAAPATLSTPSAQAAPALTQPAMEAPAIPSENPASPEDPETARMSQVTLSQNSPLGFYNEIADVLYYGAKEQANQTVEEQLYEAAEKRIDPPAVRAEILAVSAGRLSKVNAAAASKAWEAAVRAASEIADYARSRNLPNPFGPAPPPANAKNRAVQQMENALIYEADLDVRSYVFAGVAQMLFQRGEIADGLAVTRMMTKAASPVGLLSKMASELSEGKDPSAAKQLIPDIYKHTNETADDSTRLNQFMDLALFEPRVGMYRESRLTCPTFVFTELQCYTEILMQYKMRQNPKQFQDLEADYEDRYRIDW